MNQADIHIGAYLRVCNWEDIKSRYVQIGDVMYDADGNKVCSEYIERLSGRGFTVEYIEPISFSPYPRVVAKEPDVFRIDGGSQLIVTSAVVEPVTEDSGQKFFAITTEDILSMMEVE